MPKWCRPNNAKNARSRPTLDEIMRHSRGYGRPPCAGPEKRLHVVRVRLSYSELSALKQEAASAHLTLSELIRRRLFAGGEEHG